MRADINLIDHAGLAVELPQMIFDLPAKGRHIMQTARGYVGSFVAGERTLEEDEPTGALPGRLIRGARSA